ncbi:phage holin family protein [Aeromicrobium duanguangcaii]|uniref:phage holin family protein n=1 Tax=Aeromicrobium duanguangcaii TaxID=2968086 RepID=UPI00201825A9|nr:phage holin family protein [Aeromicrobium duanguangcaii]MCL3838678.1 phage holin family protein [Aeromicrobium duanguangcaii]
MLSARLWITIVTAALANALALGLAAWILDGFTLTPGWWVVAVVLFTVLSVVLRTVALRVTSSRWLRVSTITGGLALTAIALALTDVIVPDSGFAIHGWGTWVVVTLVVWAAGVAFGEVDHHAPASTPGVSPDTRAAREGERRAS